LQQPRDSRLHDFRLTDQSDTTGATPGILKTQRSDQGCGEIGAVHACGARLVIAGLF
jgi:hypothetical protein